MRSLLLSVLAVFVVGCSQQQSLSPVGTTNYEVLFSPDFSEGRILNVVCRFKTPAGLAKRGIPTPFKYAYVLFGAEIRTDTLTLESDEITLSFSGLALGAYGFGLFTIGVNDYGDSVRVHYGSTEDGAFQIKPGEITSLTLECPELFHEVSVTLPAGIPAEVASATFIMKSKTTFPNDSETVVIADHELQAELGFPLKIAGMSQYLFSYVATVRLSNSTGDLVYWGTEEVKIDTRVNNTFSISLDKVTSSVGEMEVVATLSNQTTFTFTQFNVVYN